MLAIKLGKIENFLGSAETISFRSSTGMIPLNSVIALGKEE